MPVLCPRSISILSILTLLVSPSAWAQVDEEVAPDEVPVEGEEEAIPEDEMAIDEPAEDPARPAPAGMGVVWGVITDTKYDEPLIDAEVRVVGTDKVVYADIDGRFRFELPPGTYSLRVYYELHQPEVIAGVEVAAGAVQEVDVALRPDEGAVDVIEVKTKADTSSLEGQMLRRRKSAAVGDAVGRAEISRRGDSNAAEASKRVVGATIVDGRFVYVRGLGERYTNASLDGAPLPSTEPDRNTVPLDLFPALVLDSIQIVKTFTPDVPADFAGGSVRIETRRMPEELTFQLGVEAGINDNSTFRKRLTYDGGSTDFLGIDDGTRALPGSIPDYKVVSGGEKPDGSLITREEIDGYGRDLYSPLSAHRSITPVDHGIQTVAGNSWDLGDDRRLGVIAAGTYSRKYELRVGTRGRITPSSSTFGDYEEGIDKVTWGGLAGVTYELSPDHSLSLTAIHSRKADNTATESEVDSEERGALLRETQLEFVSTALTFGQLQGEHELDDLDGAKIEWNLSASIATRDQPDTRGTVFQLDEEFGYSFEDDGLSASHFFAEQSERTFGGGLDWTQPLVKKDWQLDVKVGSLVNVRRRDFLARRFQYKPIGPTAGLVCPAPWQSDCPDQVVRPELIGSVFELREGTRANDAYEAGLDVFAGYAMIDTSPLSWLRLIGGARLEVSSQTIESEDPFDPTAGIVKGEVEGTDVLPAVAVVFKVTDDSNIRTSFSRTLARPQLREVAPFSYTPRYGELEEQGNPDLSFTYIENVDLRYELFPTPREVLSISTFYKHFNDPIEQIIDDAGARGIKTYVNAEGANLFGVELEARKTLGFLTDVLDDLSLVGNLTLAHSRVQLADEQASFVTNASRELSNASPWVLNLALDYDNQDTKSRFSVSYNIFGRRLTEVGTAGRDDTFEQPRHLLGVTAGQEIFPHLTLALKADNIIDDDFLETVGSSEPDDLDADGAPIVERYRTGRRFAVGLTYTH